MPRTTRNTCCNEIRKIAAPFHRKCSKEKKESSFLSGDIINQWIAVHRGNPSRPLENTKQYKVCYNLFSIFKADQRKKGIGMAVENAPAISQEIGLNFEEKSSSKHKNSMTRTEQISTKNNDLHEEELLGRKAIEIDNGRGHGLRKSSMLAEKINYKKEILNIEVGNQLGTTAGSQKICINETDGHKLGKKRKQMDVAINSNKQSSYNMLDMNMVQLGTKTDRKRGDFEETICGSINTIPLHQRNPLHKFLWPHHQRIPLHQRKPLPSQLPC